MEARKNSQDTFYNLILQKKLKEKRVQLNKHYMQTAKNELKSLLLFIEEQDFKLSLLEPKKKLKILQNNQISTKTASKIIYKFHKEFKSYFDFFDLLNPENGNLIKLYKDRLLPYIATYDNGKYIPHKALWYEENQEKIYYELINKFNALEIIDEEYKKKYQALAEEIPAKRIKLTEKIKNFDLKFNKSLNKNEMYQVTHYNPSSTLKKQTSFFILNNKFILFSEKHENLPGQHTVHIFENCAFQTKFIVKYFNLSTLEIPILQKRKKYLQREVTLFKEFYPQFFANLCSLNDYQFRLIVEKIPGMALCNIYINAFNARKIFYTVAKELQRLHEKNIIHGDIKEDNLILQSISTKHYLIYLIDFGNANYQDHVLICTNRKHRGQHSHIAPECFSDSYAEFKTTPHQDIYSFCYMVNFYAKKQDLGWTQEESDLFEQGINDNPLERPDLATIIDTLYKNLLPNKEMINDQSLPMRKSL